MISAPGLGGRRRKEGFPEPGTRHGPSEEALPAMEQSEENEFSGSSKYPHRKLEDQEMLLSGKVVPRLFEQQLTPPLYLLFSHLWISISFVK